MIKFNVSIVSKTKYIVPHNIFWRNKIDMIINIFKKNRILWKKIIRL
jgi:hypothetical protein